MNEQQLLDNLQCCEVMLDRAKDDLRVASATVAFKERAVEYAREALRDFRATQEETKTRAISDAGDDEG